MKKRNRHKLFICLVAFVLTSRTQSQSTYKYKAQLADIAATQFYKIDLAPQVVAKCQEGLEDIRIFDEERNQIPYILREDMPNFKIENFAEFPVIKFGREKDKQTHIILENTSEHPIDNLLLFIKNMDASRAFSVLGSDDTTHWFIIKENIYLENTFSNDGVNAVNTLSFPKSNYKYFQLTILGENVISFYLIKAGIYKEDRLQGQYLQLPNPVVFQKDSPDKKSYVQLKFNDSYRINKLNIHAEGPKYFRRNFSLTQVNKITDDYLVNGFLVSDSTNSFEINCKTKGLHLVINNEDNLPIKITSTNAFQLNIGLMVYLQANKKYYLYFGDSTAHFPKYDLAFFKDIVEKNPAGLMLKAVQNNNARLFESKPPAPANRKVMLWIIIAGIVLVLSYFTFQMKREIDQRQEKGNDIG